MTSEVRIRAPRQAEAARVAELINANSQALYGADALTPEEWEHWLRIPRMDPERDFRVAEARDGSLLGYVDVNSGGPGRDRFWIGLRLRPDAPDRAGDELVAAAETRAAETAASCAVVRGFVSGGDRAARRIFEGRGYRLIRHSLRMETELRHEPPESEWPEGISVRTYRDGDGPRVHRAVEDSFADHWKFAPTPYDEFEHWAWRPSSDSSLWFLAEESEQLAGVCLCRPHEPGDPELGWVATLGVLRPWRRRGLALALLVHASCTFYARGLRRVVLGVDAENTTGAVRLYQRAEMHISRRNDMLEKPLG